MKPEDEKTQEEKLEESILELKSKIKNTEYDLEHMFRGNALIQQKLVNAKKSLDEKQKLLDGLSQTAPEEESPKEELEKIEQEDAPDALIQQDKIEQEIEK